MNLLRVLVELIKHLSEPEWIIFTHCAINQFRRNPIGIHFQNLLLIIYTPAVEAGETNLIVKLYIQLLESFLFNIFIFFLLNFFI